MAFALGVREAISKCARRLLRKPLHAIILGTDIREYQLLCRLHEKGRYRVLFFIDEEPWSHRSTLGNAELRYRSELLALCMNYSIDDVFYCDEKKAGDLSQVKCKVIYDKN